MGEVLPFRRKNEQATYSDAQNIEKPDTHALAGAMLHDIFNQLAAIEGFASGLPKDRLISAAHHAVELQDEIRLLAYFIDDPFSENSRRLVEMAAQLDIVTLADYIASLTIQDAHRTPQRVMVYTSSYIDRVTLA